MLHRGLCSSVCQISFKFSFYLFINIITENDTNTFECYFNKIETNFEVINLWRQSEFGSINFHEDSLQNWKIHIKLKTKLKRGKSFWILIYITNQSSWIWRLSEYVKDYGGAGEVRPHFFKHFNKNHRVNYPYL